MESMGYERIEELLGRYRRMVWAVCWRRAFGNKERCREMLQEVAFRMMESEVPPPDADDPKAERRWVMLRTRSILDHWRRQSELRQDEVPMDPLWLASLDQAVEASHEEQCELVDTLQSFLDDDDRRIVALLREGFSADHIAAQLGLSRNAFYQRYRRVILRMRNIYDKLNKKRLI